ncbi:MAG: hypothetical protein ACI9U2_000658 [Bradymonadia bacterium]|jgi:hypothetical protein
MTKCAWFGRGVHPTPQQFLIDNAAIIVPAVTLLWVALAIWSAPAPTPDPVKCPFCRGSRTRRAVNPESKREELVLCAYCHGVGKLASFEIRYETVTGPCRTCKGMATVIELDGLVYPDGTPLPETTAKEVPCPAKGCTDGWQRPHKQATYGNLVPLSGAQFKAELVAVQAALAAAER